MKKPPPLPVICDSNEQKPWWFPEAEFTVQRKRLVTGDYSFDGFEDVFCVERKSLGDFVSSVIHNWVVHRKRWYRMAGMDIAAIVVEADVSDVVEHRYEGEADPKSVMGKAASITLDHGLPIMWWGSRKYCEPRVHQYMQLAAKRLGVR